VIQGILASKHFDKMLLVFLFVILGVLCLHLMHKADAGGNDSNFITWAEGAATTCLGALIGMIKGEMSASAATMPAAVTTTAETTGTTTEGK
jgi:hypothetical protein